MVSSVRYAILIGNGHYADERLDELRCPEQDVDGLADVLGDPHIGQFDEIKRFINCPHTAILRETELLLQRVRKNDLILFYFSGHGKLDTRGGLCLAVEDTESIALGATSISLRQIKDFIDSCMSSRVVIILDCCFSGAAGEIFTKGGVDDYFQLMASGRGKYIMTASTAIQTAHEKDGEMYSVFTKHLIEGLKTGDADLDADGHITIDELYRYVYTEVREESHQEPMRWDLDSKGKLVIAFSPKRQAGIAVSAAAVVRTRYDYDAIIQMFKKEEVIPFLGPDVWSESDKTKPPIYAEVARRLAQSTGFADNDDPLTLLAQKIDIILGRGVVYNNIKALYQPESYIYAPALVHRFLARVEHPLLILSTTYDTLLEDAFDTERRPYVVVTHALHTERQGDRGKVIVQYSDRKNEVEKLLSEDLVIDLDHWSVIYKIHGTFGLFDPDSNDEIDSIVISEEDYISLVAILENPQTTIPNHLARQFRKRMFLFLGYSMNDWSFRAVVDIVHRRGNFRRVQPYAVRRVTSEFEYLFWENKRVRLIDADVSTFIRDMAVSMGIPL